MFASREVWPFVEGGGIGRCVWAAARLLAPHADVSVLTSEVWRERYEQMVAAGDERLPEGVRFAFVEEPGGDLSPFVAWHHAWSERLLRGVAELHPHGGPDLIEVADYQGEGFACAHAIRGGDPRVRRSRLLVRLSTSSEICSVLNEEPAEGAARFVRGIERFTLRFADDLMWPGGDVLSYYRDFYGADGLAEAVETALPVGDDMVPGTPLPAPPADGPVRILYLNRLERRKGIEELVAAIVSLPQADLELTIVGRDTMTAPDGGSMKAHLKALAEGDDRIHFEDQVPHAEILSVMAAHHVVAVPARWETFSYVTREAVAANRPVLATPSGAIVDIVHAGRSGWLARSSAQDDLADAVETMLRERDLLTVMIAEGRPRAVFQESLTNDRQVEVYDELARRDRPAPAEARPTIDVVISLDGDGTGLDRTLRCLDAQGATVTSVAVLSDDQRAPGPSELMRLTRVVATASREGRTAAWGHGLATTEAGLVALLPAGTVLEDGFLARAAAVLEAVEAIDYVTAFVDRGSMPWHAPIGSFALPIDSVDAGGSVAVFRRTALVDLPATVTDEAGLFAALSARDAVGLVLHEPLVRGLPARPHAG